MSPEKLALADVWKAKRFWLLYALGAAAWLGLALGWFWLPDSSVWGVVLSAVVALIVIASGFWLIRRALKFFGASPRAILRPRVYPSVAILAVAGGYVPYKLTGWHPQLAGLGLQTASLVIRFGLAFVMAVTAWLILVALLGRLGTDSEAGRSPASPPPLAPQTAQPNP